MKPDAWTDISTETDRYYIYESGHVYRVPGPQALHVSASGGHRITRQDGRKVYVAPGWVAIEFDGDWVV